MKMKIVDTWNGMTKTAKIISVVIGLIVVSSIYNTITRTDSEPIINNNDAYVQQETVNSTPTKSPEEVKADYERSKEDLSDSINELKESVDNSYHQATGTEHKTEYERMREQAISVTWRDVVDDYEDNTIAADGKYKDQYLKMSGTVSDIGREILGQPYVTFERDVTHGIRVTFDKSEEDKIAKLSKGAAITIVGKCAGELITGTVDMNNCYITY